MAARRKSSVAVPSLRRDRRLGVVLEARDSASSYGAVGGEAADSTVPGGPAQRAQRLCNLTIEDGYIDQWVSLACGVRCVQNVASCSITATSPTVHISDDFILWVHCL